MRLGSRWPYRSFVDVDYPGFGVIVVGGERFEHDVVVEACPLLRSLDDENVNAVLHVTC
jgi:hypothetical protein